VLFSRPPRHAVQGVPAFAVAAGSVGVAHDDKGVQVSVDGKPSSVHVMGSTVADVLDKQDIAVGPHDVVVPSVGSSVDDGHQRPTGCESGGPSFAKPVGGSSSVGTVCFGATSNSPDARTSSRSPRRGAKLIPVCDVRTHHDQAHLARFTAPECSPRAHSAPPGASIPPPLFLGAAQGPPERRLAMPAIKQQRVKWTAWIARLLLSALVAVTAATSTHASAAVAADGWISDSFNRVLTGTWGSAELGGAWSRPTGKVTVAVTPGSGQILGLAPGRDTRTTLPATSSRDVTVAAAFAVPNALPFYQSVEARGKADPSDRSAYRARVVIRSGQPALLQLLRVDALGTLTTLKEAVLPLSPSAGEGVIVEMSVTGGDVPLLQGRARRVGEAVPSWQVSATDAGSARITTAGVVGLHSYLSRSAQRSVTVAFSRVTASSITPFVLGTTKPDSSNSGVTPGTSLTPVQGDVTYTTPGQVIEGKEFNGHVYVKANDVTFRNCLFRGPSTATGFVTYGLVQAEYGYTGILIDRSTFNPTIPKWWLVGVRGAGFTVNRSDFSRLVDGVYAFGGSATLQGSYVHDLSFFDNSEDQRNSTYHPYWTHNDGVQLLSGSGHRVVGNNFQAYAAKDAGTPATLTNNGYPKLNWPAGVTVSPDKGPVTASVVKQNWFEGGAAGFQMNYLYPTTGMDFGEISQNRFGMDQWDYGTNDRYQIRYKSGAVIAGLTTNYFDPNAPSVPVEKRGQMFSVGFQSGIRVS
jgi:hypothetical protein